MKIEEIINIIRKHLNNEITNNKTFKELLNTFINEVKDRNNNPKFYIEVESPIYSISEELQNLKNVEEIKSSKTNIFNISTDLSVSVCFSLSKIEEEYIINLSMTNLNDDKVEIIEIDAKVPKLKNDLIQITKIIMDDEDYYYEYETEFISYDKHGKKVEIPNIEEQKDEDFSKTFGISINESRNYRLNFDKYKDKLNQSKSKLNMKSIDNMFTLDSVLFSPVFKLTTFKDFIQNLEGDAYDEEELEDDLEEIDIDFDSDIIDETIEEDYDEEFDELDKRSEERSEILENTLISYLGKNGDFTISYNLYLNMKTYILSKNDLINTTGIIIRKINNEHTIFYMTITNNQIIMLPYKPSKEELMNLYKSDPMNQNMYGLDEFFDIDKKHTLKPEN